MTQVMKMPDLSEQLATAGQASRAREVRDQKFFVKSLFAALDEQKQEIASLKELLNQVIEKLEKPKKAEKSEKTE